MVRFIFVNFDGVTLPVRGGRRGADGGAVVGQHCGPLLDYQESRRSGAVRPLSAFSLEGSPVAHIDGRCSSNSPNYSVNQRNSSRLVDALIADTMEFSSETIAFVGSSPMHVCAKIPDVSLGLGVMGYPMALNLSKGLHKSHTLFICDVVPDALQRFRADTADLGPVQVVENGFKAVRRADMVITMLPGSAAVKRCT